MRDGGNVFNGRHDKAGLLYGTDGRFAALTRPTDLDGDFAHTKRNGFFSRFVAGDLRSKRSAFFGAFKTVRTSGGPSNRLPKYTRSTEISAGDTPEIRDACAIVLGAYFLSF